MRAIQISGIILLIVIIGVISYTSITIGAIITALVTIIAVSIYLLSRKRILSTNKKVKLKEAATYFKTACINDKLRTAFILIIKNKGVDFLSQRDCLNYLSDLYNFSVDYESKKILAELIDDGNLKALINKRGDKSEILLKAYSIAKDNLYVSFKSNLVGDVIITLISALSNITCNDILSYSKYEESTRNPKNNIPKDNYVTVISYIVGLLLMYGGTLFYLAYFSGWWMFFIVLITGIIHSVFIIAITMFHEECNYQSKDHILVVNTPVFFGFLINAIVGFVFTLSATDFYEYIFGYHPYSYDLPSEATTILLILDIFTIGALILLSTGAFIDVIKGNIRLLIYSSIIVILGYIFLFSIPLIDKIVKIVDYNITSEYTMFSNKIIRLSRQDTNPKLAFKNIMLGMNFTEVTNIIGNLEDEEYRLPIRNNYTNYCDIDMAAIEEEESELFPTETIYIYLKNELAYDIPKSWGVNYDLAEGLNESRNSSRKYKTDIIGKFKTLYTDFDNKRIVVYIFENNGKVGAIMAKYLYEDFDVKDNMTSMKLLYSKKYGSPEKLLKPSSESQNALFWTLKNSTIYLDSQTILYIDSAFISRIIRESEAYKQEQRLLQEQKSKQKQLERQKIEQLRIKKEQQRQKQEQQKLLQEQAEKARRDANHKNAINEI